MTDSIFATSRAFHWWGAPHKPRNLFSVYGINEHFDFDEIVYILTRWRGDGFYDALYVGQSGQGDVRLSSHEKMSPARGMGATHVHVHFIGNRSARFKLETELRHLLNPPLNKQGVPSNSLAAQPMSAFGALSLADVLTPNAGTANALGALRMPSPAPRNTLAGALSGVSPYYNALTALPRKPWDKY